MKASSIIIYAVVLWASVCCDARRLDKSLDEGERGSNLTQELGQEAIQHVTSAPVITSERTIPRDTTLNFIRDIPLIPEDSKIQSLKNDDQVQVSYSRKITIDKDSSEDTANAQNKSVNSVKNDEISYKLNKTGTTSFLRTDMHISHSAYESSSSSVLYDDEYEENDESGTKEIQPKISSIDESKVDLEKKIFEAKKKEKNKKEILDSATVPSDHNGPGRIEKPYKENSISNKLKEKNKESITEALDDRRSTTIRINTSSDRSSNKSSVSDHDNKPLGSLDIFKMVSSGTIQEELVNQSVNSVINGNGVNNEYKKNRVKYSLKKAHENVNDTEADNSSKSGNILNEETARYQGETLDSQAAHSDTQNGAVELPVREIVVPFQHQHQTESTPTKLDMFGNPPQPQPPPPTALVKPSLAFKQQLANKIKGLEPVSPTGSNLTVDSLDEIVEKSTGKSSTKGVLKKKPKIDQLHSSSEMNIPPTATAWTLVSMRTGAEGLTTSRKPVSSTDHPSTASELLTKASAKYTTISPVSRIKSFVPWSTRLHRTTPKPSPTSPSFDFKNAVDKATADTDAEIFPHSSSNSMQQNNDQVSSTEKLTSTTEQQSVIRTTLELERNITDTSVKSIQPSLNDVMVKDQSSTVTQFKSTTTISPVVETMEFENATILDERNSTANVLQSKLFDNENIIDVKQSVDVDKGNETDKFQDKVEEIPSLAKNITVNEVLSADLNENINEVKNGKSKNNINITLTIANHTDLEREKMQGNSEMNDFYHGVDLDAGEDVKSEEESEEEEKPKQITTTAPFIEQSETTIIPDLDEEEGENEREEDELSIPENSLSSQNKNESNSKSNDTIIEIKPISTASTPTESRANESGFYVTSFDIISKENTTQVVTNTPEEGDKNWYEIESKSAFNTTKLETNLDTVTVEITTAPSIDTNESATTTEEAIEETTIFPETSKTVLTSPTTETSVTTPDAATVPDNEDESDACVKLHVLTSSFKLCYSQQQIRENIAAQLVNNNVSWDQVMVMAKDLEGCQLKTLSDEEEELEVYVCFADKSGQPSSMIRNEFVRRKANTPSINFDDVGMSTAQPGVMEEGIDNVLAAIILSVIAAVCLLVLGILLVVIRKRQGKFNYGQRCTPVSLDDYSLDNISVYNSVRRKGARRASKRSYGNPAFDDPGGPTHPINFAGLANFSNDREALDEEFNQIPMITVKPDELPPGVESKNRYANVIPLPETRVVLQLKDGADSTDDYINANFVKSIKGQEKLYIACQAPLQTTVEDFWKMVWQQQTKVILMLTALNEQGVEKCADYLPQLEVSDCHRLFGDFQVTLKSHEVREKYLISSLQLKNLETNSWREVTHLWYSSWPAQGVPDDGSAMIAFLIEARSYMRGAQGPTVVHCSPGTGRTGTVIAIDLCIRDFETQRSVDIPRTVYSLRRSRAGAVQTKDQYAFIYQVLNLYATKLTGGALDSI